MPHIELRMAHSALGTEQVSVTKVSAHARSIESGNRYYLEASLRKKLLPSGCFS